MRSLLSSIRSQLINANGVGFVKARVALDIAIKKSTHLYLQQYVNVGLGMIQRQHHSRLTVANTMATVSKNTTNSVGNI